MKHDGNEAVKAHRGWRLPNRPWRVAMTWEHVAFLHWRVPPGALRAQVPPGLELDCFDGTAWLGVVPFGMSGVRLRPLPPFPGTRAFPELNLRTYVTAGGKPGVWFFSLDAASRMVVRVARRLYHLPYYDASMRLDPGPEGISYHSRRIHPGAPAAAFEASYGPTGAVISSQPGSLEHFLTERYCLYAADAREQVWRSEIDHPPWPLHSATAEMRTNTLANPLGVPLSESPATVHYARRVEVVAWSLERVGAETTATCV
jgi:hypothetical protein